MEQQPNSPRFPHLPLDLVPVEPTLAASNSELAHNASINTDGTLHPRTELEVSTLHMVSEAGSPTVFLQRPNEILLRAMDHMVLGRATELRKILAYHATISNEIIPSMAAFHELSRYHDLHGKPLLYWAASTSSTEVVEALLDAGADINKPAQIFPCNTPLMAAAARSDTAIVKLLLKKGASVGTVNAYGITALSMAAHHARDPQIVEKMLQAVEIMLQNKANRTAYMWVRNMALKVAVCRRAREYGGPDHATLTRVARILTTVGLTEDAALTPTACFDLFLEPWKRVQEWASLIDEDEKKSLLYLIGRGLDLSQSFAPPQLHSDATLDHALLFHCWESDMPRFLSRNLGDLPNKVLVGQLLFRTLTAGCSYDCSQGSRVAEATSALLETPFNPECGYESGWSPVSIWISPITEDFELYKPDFMNLRKFWDVAGDQLSLEEIHLLLRTAYIVSMKKYLASQFSADKSLRAYDKISYVLRELSCFAVPPINFPTDFVLDTISLVPHFEQQMARPIVLNNDSDGASFAPLLVQMPQIETYQWNPASFNYIGH